MPVKFLPATKNILLKNSISSAKLIIGGDFNCVINSELDRKREAEAKSTSKDYSTASGELIEGHARSKRCMEGQKP